MNLLRVLAAILLAGGSAAAQPTIAAVVNNASGVLQGLPNGGIAQGSIFLLVGSGLGPAATVVSTAPFQTSTLGQTTVNVTPASGPAVNVPLYYSSATQVSALLPSSMAVGAATVTVTYNGQVSAAANFSVVANNVGIFTIGQNGQGAAVVTYPDYSLVSAVPGTGAVGGGGPGTFSGAANVGDTLTLWTTGLGPVSGNETGGAGLGVNMPSIPLTIWLGGVQANISYQGRSGCCIGEDQIAFVVPAGVPTGCAVPLTAQIGTVVSNSTFIAVASGSRTCTPSNPALTQSAVQGLSSTASSPTYAQILLKRQIASTTSGVVYQDVAEGAVGKLTAAASIQPLLPSYFDSAPLGTCATFNSLTAAGLPSTTTASLDAGQITIKNPIGFVSILAEKPSGGQPTQYSDLLSSTGTYFSGGTFTLAGAGGNDVGPFSASFTISPTPTWSSQAQFQISQQGVTRANGMTITWTGGSSAYYVEIDGRAATDGTGTVGAGFTCLVPSAAGSFTVPASTLEALPGSIFGEVDFKPTLVPVPFQAAGLTFGYLVLNFQTSVFPTFK